MFSGLDVDKIMHLFTSKCASICSDFIPNKTLTCDNCLWSDMLCQLDGVVSDDFMTNFAFMTNHTQK